SAGATGLDGMPCSRRSGKAGSTPAPPVSPISSCGRRTSCARHRSKNRLRPPPIETGRNQGLEAFAPTPNGSSVRQPQLLEHLHLEDTIGDRAQLVERANRLDSP